MKKYLIKSEILVTQKVTSAFYVLMLIIYIFCFSSCNPNANSKDSEELNLSSLVNVLNSHPDRLEQSLDTCAVAIYSKQFDLYCYSSDYKDGGFIKRDPSLPDYESYKKSIHEYKLLKTEENEGKVLKYAVATLITYSKKGEVKVITLSGNFKTPEMFKTTSTYATFDKKIIKKVLINNEPYYMMCYNPERSFPEMSTSCDDSKVLDKPVVFEKNLILFKDAYMPQIIFKIKDNFYTYSRLF